MSQGLLRVLNAIPLLGGLFPNAYHVAKREYLVRVRSRTFIILTAGLAVVGLSLALLPLGLRLLGGDKPVNVAVYSTADGLSVDPAATLQSVLDSMTGGSATGGGSGRSGPRFTVSAVSDPIAAKQAVTTGSLDGLLSITRSADGDLAFDAFTKASPSDQNLALVRQAATSIAISDRLERAGVSAVDRGRIFAPTAFTTTPADSESARRSREDFGPAYVLAYVFIILFFMAIQVYGTWVATSVAEEKSSRVMELLISAASPRQLLFGKVLGTSLAGLTQYAAILVAAVVGLLLQGVLAERLLGDPTATLSITGLTPLLVIGYSIFFVLGFLLFAVLYAAAGSMATRQEDVQQIIGPLTFIGLGGYLLSFVALPLIDAGWVRIASWVPFLSCFLFPARIALSPPAPWEYAVAIILTLVAILGAIWVAARIYAAGVLLYGQRPTLRGILRATLQAR